MSIKRRIGGKTSELVFVHLVPYDLVGDLRAGLGMEGEKVGSFRGMIRTILAMGNS